MRVKIEKLDNFGRGITYLNGKIAFIENALPNEEVEIEIVKETKKFLEGKVIKYYETSKERIDVACPYYNVCGGCDLEHISLALENEFKEQKIKNILQKFAGVSKAISPIETKEAYSYRNKITFHVKNKKIGFYKNNSNDLIEIDYCLLANKKINSLIKPLKELAKKNDLVEIMIRTTNDEKEVLIHLKGNVSTYEEILPLVDVLIINDKVVTKSSSLITKIGSKNYHLSATSFFQVNKELTKDLYDEVLNVVKANSYEKVLDLYCGTGSIGLYISDYVKTVIGIDYNEANIKDAKENKKLNKSKNCEFICAKVEDVIDNYSDIDLIIVDPPRAGLKKSALDTIIKIKPRCLVYISCDVITLARDLNFLKEKYKIKMIKPFNMFPRTYHLESFCILNLK